MRAWVLFFLLFAPPSWASVQYACFESTRDYTTPHAPKPESLMIDGDSVTWGGYPRTQWSRNNLSVGDAPCTLTMSRFLGAFNQSKSYCWKEESTEMHFIYAVFDGFTRGPNQSYYKCLQIK